MMAALIRITAQAFLKSISLEKTPLYALIAAALYMYAPAFAMAASIKLLLSIAISLVVAPLVVTLVKTAALSFFTYFKNARSRSQSEAIAHRLRYKSLYELIPEVNKGNYQDFRAHLSLNNTTDLTVQSYYGTTVDFAQLGKALQGTAVTTLRIQNHAIGNIRAVTLAHALKGTKVTALYLNNNSIENPTRLIETLKGTQVTTLDLSNNKISPQGVENLGTVLQDSPLTTLTLANNQIGPQGLAKLTLKGSKITTLDLSNNNLAGGDATIWGNFLNDTSLTILYLSGNNLNAADAVNLGNALKGTQVATLSLTSNNIGPDGAVNLVKALQATQVAILYLALNNIGPDGAANLSRALVGTQVTHLLLNNNNIGNDGAAKLSFQDTKVTMLYLEGNNIGNEGAIRFADCIYGTILVDIIGVQHPELTEALKLNRLELRTMQLNGYYMASLKHLPGAEKAKYDNLPQLTASATAEDKLKFGGGLMIKISEIPELERLVLSRLPGVNVSLAQQFQLATAKAALKKKPQVDTSSIQVNANSKRPANK